MAGTATQAPPAKAQKVAQTPEGIRIVDGDYQAPDDIPSAANGNGRTHVPELTPTIAPDAAAIMRLAPAPTAADPLSYTVALSFGGAVFAGDDFTEAELQEFRAEEAAALKAQTDAVEAAARATEEIAAIRAEAKGRSGERLKALATRQDIALRAINTANADFELAKKQQVQVNKAWVLAKIKGVRQEDGTFAACDPAALLCTAPAYKALINSLVNRAELGSDERDFLG